MGTPSYMAPEQAAGTGVTRGVGPAAATSMPWGRSCMNCLTGRPPFKAATPLETILQVVQR